MHGGVERMEEDPGSPGPPTLEDQHGMEVIHPVQKSAKTIQNEIRQRLTKLREKYVSDVSVLAPHTMCTLCRGGFRDPVVSIQCFHTYCNLCWSKHSHRSTKCPVCSTEVEATKPLLSLRCGTSMYEMVYRILSGGMVNKTEHKPSVYSLLSELDRAEDAGQFSERIFFAAEDDISMSLECYNPSSSKEASTMITADINGNENTNRRFLECPGSVTVAHLKKFITSKYSLDSQAFVVDVIYKDELLDEDQTLTDIAYAFDWKKTSPMQFFYQVYQRTMICTRKREKKRTKAASTNKRSPPAKRMRMETSATVTSNGSSGAPWKSPGRETAESDMSRLTSRLEPTSRNAIDASSTPVSTKLKISLSRGSVEDGSGKSGKKSPITATISRSPSNISLSSNDSGKKSDKSSNHKSKPGQKTSSAANLKQPIVKAVPTASPVSPRKVDGSSSALHKTSNTKATVTSYIGKSGSTSLTTVATAKSSASQAISVSKQSNASKTSASKGASAQVKTVTATTTPKLTSILKNSGSNVAPVPQGILKNSNTSTVKPNAVTAGSKPTVKSVTTDSSKAVLASTKAVNKPTTDKMIKPVPASKPHEVKSTNMRPTPPLKPILKHPTPDQKKMLLEQPPKISMLTPASKGEKPQVTIPKSILKPSTPDIKVGGTTSTNSLLKPLNKKKEVVEISVEVSASDVKKVLEKKKAEKDHLRLSLGTSSTPTSTGVEDKLYSNYSIVDQIKKAGSSALARHQTEQRAASMMDFTRGSDALTCVPKVPPTIQGLQPKLKNSTTPTSSNSTTESTALSTIVQNLAQKQQKQLLENGVSTKKDESAPNASNNNNNKSEGKSDTKSLAALVSSPVLTAKAGSKADLSMTATSKAAAVASTNQLPVSTSIRAVTSKSGNSLTTSLDASSKQAMNFYKNNLIATSKPSSSLSEAVKSAESLAKSIPAGTTVTVKTIDGAKNSGKRSPVTSAIGSQSPKPRSPKTFASNKVSSASYTNSSSMSRPSVNPFMTSAPSLAISQAQQPVMMMNQFHNSLGAMALAAQLQFNNPVAALAAAQMEAAMRAAQQQAAISMPSSMANPVTTLNFTKPTFSNSLTTADELSSRYGLKIPTPPSRTSSPAVSGFGTSRLQVKVNSDSPRKSGSPSLSSSGDTGTTAAVRATHSMPAILPFPTVKKALAIPKSQSQPNRPQPTSLASILASQSFAPPTSSIWTYSSPSAVSKPSTPPSGMFRSVTPAQVAQVNSLKKLAADLNTVHQKTLKGDNNILNPLKKSSGGNEGKKMMDGNGLSAKEGVTSS